MLEKIKELRNKTGISITECQKALLVNDMNIEKSILYLREKGILQAALKAERITTAGLIGLNISTNKKTAIMTEINCETDFVVKSDEIQKLLEKINNYFLNDEKNSKNINLSTNIILPKELELARIDLITQLGENIIVRRLTKLSTKDDFIFGYTHRVNQNIKIASIFVANQFLEQYMQLYNDIAMQITAMKPQYVAQEDIPQNILNQERNINKDISRFLKEQVLLEQPFIKEQKTCIKELISNKFTLLTFVRFEVGEKIS
ncbi:MAG TPA: translation elongation factor Ts [Candidatus Azoamicus sp. OHIO2]